MRAPFRQLPFAFVVLLAASACGVAASACSSASPGTVISAGRDGAPSASDGADDGGPGTLGPTGGDASDSTPTDAGTPDAPSGSPPADSSAGDSSSTHSDAATGVSVTMEVTAYGWDDNSPPGNAIAYPANGGFPTLHDVASGTGTYADPITFATDMNEYPPGTILYVPFLEKYVIMEDDCTQCDSDWTSSMTRHIDVWMNSNGTESSSALFSCEDTWTRSATEVVTSPPSNLPVTTAPLFDPATNTCRTTP